MPFGFIQRLVNAARISACVALVLIGAFLGARWSMAQTAGKPASKPKATRSNAGLEQLAAIVTHLQDTGQTNTERLFYEYAYASEALRHSVELGVTTRILLRLREGRINEAIRMLEMRLSSQAVGFASSYGKLPGPVREQLGLTSLGRARDYCSEYQVKSSNTNIAAMEANAFNLLDETQK